MEKKGFGPRKGFYPKDLPQSYKSLWKRNFLKFLASQIIIGSKKRILEELIKPKEGEIISGIIP